MSHYLSSNIIKGKGNILPWQQGFNETIQWTTPYSYKLKFREETKLINYTNYRQLILHLFACID